MSVQPDPNPETITEDLGVQPAATPSDKESPTGGPKRVRLVEMAGKPYAKFILSVLNYLEADSYFEIGTATGASLSAVPCKAVAVDPKFALKGDAIGAKQACMFFQVSSDRFFREYNLTALLGGPFAVSFLDGFHIYEYLLRDFMNTEKHGRKNSVIFMHDCLPWNPAIAARKRGAGKDWLQNWTGDVWKVVPILKKYRPDLVIHALDCPPTGLIMVTNLDPSNRILEDRYFDIIAEYAETSEDARNLRQFLKSTPLVRTGSMHDNSDLAKYLRP